MLVKRKCMNCGKEFDFYECRSHGTKGRFCSRDCYNEFLTKEYIKKNCLWCNQEFVIPRWRNNQKFCSQSCSAKYAKKTFPNQRPKCSSRSKKNREERRTSNGKRIGLHRYLMEKKIGRELLFKETVHHIDMNMQNNAIENLWLYNDESDHQKGHRSLERLVVGLIADGVIEFAGGKYGRGGGRGGGRNRLG